MLCVAHNLICSVYTVQLIIEPSVCAWLCLCVCLIICLRLLLDACLLHNLLMLNSISTVMFLSNFFFSFCLSFLLSLFYLIDSKFANQIRIMQRAKIVIEIIWIYLFGGLFDMLLILKKNKWRIRQRTRKSHWTDRAAHFIIETNTLWNVMHDTIQLISQIETQFQKSLTK